jgi:hypothetical protein
MTMFSMKPQFNLAEFLAVPAPKGAARNRGGRSRAMQPRPDPAAAETSEAVEPVATPKADASK